MSEKIFDPEIEKYLLQAGVSQKEIYRMKFDAMKKDCITILERALVAFKNAPDEKIIKNLVSHSPAGDCMGTDQYFLDFADTCGNQEPMDIVEAIEKLNTYHSFLI